MQVRLRLRRNQEFTCNGAGVGVDQACAFLQRSSHELTPYEVAFMMRKASCELSIKPSYAWCEPLWHPYEPVGPSSVPHVQS
eukprot:2279137-Pleurochrysis_carterae.AAC.1